MSHNMLSIMKSCLLDWYNLARRNAVYESGFSGMHMKLSTTPFGAEIPAKLKTMKLALL